MRILLFVTCLLVLPVQATEKITVESGQYQTAVVELYTSEGCSSCPPADKWLEALVEVPSEELDLLALAFHVDYWDYLGWRDRFGSPMHTSRQRQLGTNNRQTTIYTPEFFVDGMEARGTRNVIAKIRDANSRPAELQLKLAVSKTGQILALELHSDHNEVESDALRTRFFVYENQLSSDVKRGENSGEHLRHQQVVRYMSKPTQLTDFSTLQIEIDDDWDVENIGVAALVTSVGNEAYLQAVHTPIIALLR